MHTAGSLPGSLHPDIIEHLLYARPSSRHKNEGKKYILQSCEFVGAIHSSILRITNVRLEKLKPHWDWVGRLSSWDGAEMGVHILAPPFIAWVTLDE